MFARAAVTVTALYVSGRSYRVPISPATEIVH